MMMQKKFIVLGTAAALLLAAWQGWIFFEHRRESASIVLRNADPFAMLVIPPAYAADPATKKVIEDKIAATKALYEKQPDVWETWIAIGNLKALLQDFDGAIAAYQESHVLQANNILGFRNIAEVYNQHLHDYEKAETYYQLAIRQQNNDPALYAVLAFVQYKHLGKNEDAEKTYVEGLRAAGYASELLTALIQFYKDTGNTEKYLENVRVLLAQHPDNQLYKDAYAKELAAMGLKL